MLHPSYPVPDGSVELGRALLVSGFSGQGNRLVDAETYVVCGN